MRDITVEPLGTAHLGPAAELFLAGLARSRALVPQVPDTLADPARLAERLAQLVDAGQGVAAFRGGRLIGYLGAFVVDGFRRTPARGAYSPVWAHGALGEDRDGTYRQLYRAACGRWTAAGCAAHAVTVFAHDRTATGSFFHNGFGVTVVDAVRPIGGPDPIGSTGPAGPTGACGSAGPAGAPRTPEAPGPTIRRAGPTDLEAVIGLETDLIRHLAGPPVLMPSRVADRDEIAGLLRGDAGACWLACDADGPIGHLSIVTSVDGAADVLRSPATVAVSAAYVRPDVRGRGIATALLAAALCSCAREGRTACSVDYESFNPQARAFWERHFTPVCLSLVRRPESLPGPR